MDRLTSLVYFSEPFARAYRALMDSLGRGQSLVVLIAPNGAARDALWRGVTEAMTPSHLEVIADGRVNAAAIGRTIAGHATPVVVVMDAEDLPAPAFAQLEKLLDPIAPIPAAQVLLVGSERLAQRLRHPEALALAARVQAWSNLSPEDARAVATFMGETTPTSDAPHAPSRRSSPLRWVAAAAVIAVGVTAVMMWPRLREFSSSSARPATAASAPAPAASATSAVAPVESTPTTIAASAPAEPVAAPLAETMSPAPAAPTASVSPTPAAVAVAVAPPTPMSTPPAVVTSRPPVAAPVSSSGGFSEADALARGRALAARGDVRAVSSLKEAMARRPEGITADTSAGLAALLVEAQVTRLRLDREQIQKAPRAPQPRN